MLELAGHEELEFLAVFDRDVCEATVDRGAEIGERIVVAAVKDIAFDKFPESLDQVEVGRIRRLERQPHIERRREVHDQRAVLIASVIQHESDWSFPAEGRDLAEQFAHRVRGHGAGGRDADERIRHRVPSSQDAISLAARGSANKQTTLAPQAALERALNEVGRIDAKYLAVLRSRLFQQRLQRVVEELGLSRRVLGDVLWLSAIRVESSVF